MRDLVPLHLVDLLDEVESAAVRAHLETGCPRCHAELASARETLAHLPSALLPSEPSPMVKARLMTSIRGETAAARRAAAPKASAAAGERAWSPVIYALAASLAAALLTGAVMMTLLQSRHGAETAALRERLDEQSRQITRQSEELASLRQQVRDANESIQLVRSPAVRVIDLAGQGDRSQSAARIFWDRGRGTWQLYAANLPPAAAGKTYQLWFVTDKAKISAGVFDSVEGGEASLNVRVPPETGAIVAAAITEEPAGGSPQPTGSILLVGKT
jgi:anti-sigma-K factor RskA